MDLGNRRDIAGMTILIVVVTVIIIISTVFLFIPYISFELTLITTNWNIYLLIIILVGIIGAVYLLMMRNPEKKALKIKHASKRNKSKK